MITYAVILAGGQGSRFGGNVKKQFLMFHGKELWKHLYDKIVEVIPPQRVVVVGVDIPGGSTRNESVKKGLSWINERGDCNRVLICEAARALVTKKQLLDIIEDHSSSCCFATPVVDTVMINDGTYLNRQECRHLVSPQAFDFSLLYKAYQDSVLDDGRTDDTRLMCEVYGIRPHLLDGDDNLYKVTYPKDIAVIEAIYTSMNT